ncbi:MAG: thioredoxin domain-containing protein [Candidatus Omnitrophota bacterium]
MKKTKISKITATIIVMIACVISVHAAKFILKSLRSHLPNYSILARAKGNPKAPIKIIEYLDFQCPACAKGAIALKEYLKKYPSQIYLEVKHYPISQIHKYALKSASYAECSAKQGKFWEFHDFLVKEQSRWERLLNVDAIFREKAHALGLDLKKLDACVESEETKAGILKEKEQGKALGIKSTPTYFINGKMVVGMISLKQALDRHFAEQKTGKP